MITRVCDCGQQMGADELQGMQEIWDEHRLTCPKCPALDFTCGACVFKDLLAHHVRHCKAKKNP